MDQAVFKLYRNHYGITGESSGFSWHASRAAALSAAKIRDDVAQRAEEFRIDDSRDALVAFLNRVATHADNG